MLASLGFAAGAQAAPSESKGFPANTLTYSAASVALNSNNLVIPLSVFNFTLGNESISTASVVTITAPPGTTFSAPAATAFFFGCGPRTTTGSNGQVFAPATLPAAAITSTGAWTAACQAGDQIQLIDGTDVGVTLNAASKLASADHDLTIYAQWSNDAGFFNDSAAFPLITLLSANTIHFRQRANTQLVDLSGSAASTPGTVFSGTGAPVAGLLGTFNVAASQDVAATTGGPITTASAAFPTGETATISGNFTSIASAYLVPGSNVATACVAPAPAGAIAATSVSATQIVFALPAPANFATALGFAVCVLNTPGAQIPVTNTTTNAVENVTALAAIAINPANEAFGSIIPNGSVAFFNNMFGAANFYPLFIRAANQTGAPAPLFAVVARDGGATFVTAGGALASVPANNAVQLSADTIATAAGTSLPAGSAHATLKIMSPTTGVLFSGISQNAVTLDISVLQ